MPRDAGGSVAGVELALEPKLGLAGKMGLTAGPACRRERERGGWKRAGVGFGLGRRTGPAGRRKEKGKGERDLGRAGKGRERVKGFLFAFSFGKLFKQSNLNSENSNSS